MHSVYSFEWTAHDSNLLHIMCWYTSLIFQLLFSVVHTSMGQIMLFHIWKWTRLYHIILLSQLHFFYKKWLFITDAEAIIRINTTEYNASNTFYWIHNTIWNKLNLTCSSSRPSLVLTSQSSFMDTTLSNHCQLHDVILRVCDSRFPRHWRWHHYQTS